MMTQENLTRLLQDETTVNAVLSVLKNKDPNADAPRDGMPSSEEATFVGALIRYLPDRERALVKKIVCALLLLSVLGQTRTEKED